MRVVVIATLATLTLAGEGCASRRVAARSVLVLAPDMMAALYDEADLETARASAVSAITLLEGVHRANGRNDRSAALLAEAYGGIAFNFLRDESAPRAREFFRRGRAYAAEAMVRRRPRLAAAIDGGDIVALRTGLEHERDRKLAPLLFWYALNWAGELDAAGPSVARPRDLPRMRLLINQAAALDEGYLFGAPRLLQANLACGVPQAYGRDLEAGGKAFDRVLAVSEGRLLLARVEYARLCATAAGDRARFDRELAAVMEASADVLPDHRLLTAVAKRRAERLVALADALFGATAALR